MGWLILLMAVVLLSVGVVSRNLLLRQVDAAVNTALGQEVREFSGVAAGGIDRATRKPFKDIHELLYNHLQRQVADDDEVLVGAFRTTGDWQVLGQDRLAPLPLHERPDLLDPILRAPESFGSVPTERGEMRWAKVPADSPTEPGTEGMFVVGYFVDRDRAEVDRTVQTLALVSLLGLVLTAAASWLIAGRILAPVRQVNAAAAQITERDLTRRIPVEGNDEFAALSAQFNAMLDRLEGAFATQRTFLDDASHELRTPITIIRGHLELLDANDPDERAAVLRLCTDELDRMSRMVGDLLLLAKAERPDFVNPEPVELAELTSDIHAKIRALGARQWRLDGIGEGVVVLDPQRITQAMVQLAQNAVQHTDDGDEIRFGSALNGDRVSLWVTDTGPGVRPAEAEVIFERFRRGGVRPRNRSGAGLGLAIVKAIAEAHHGAAKLVSTPGHGASFGIELPADRSAR
jgi:two-component system OmpR family sensor kinase